jgi:hypothetical protein
VDGARVRRTDEGQTAMFKKLIGTILPKLEIEYACTSFFSPRDPRFITYMAQHPRLCIFSPDIRITIIFHFWYDTAGFNSSGQVWKNSARRGDWEAERPKTTICLFE